MKRTFILFYLTVFILVAVVGGSILTVDKTKYNNDFIRIFPPHFTSITATLKIEKGKFSLAGIMNNKIYLRDRSSQCGVLMANMEMTDTTHAPLQIPKDFEFTLDSPYFLLYSGYVPAIQRGRTSSWSIDTTFKEIPGFTLMQPISKTVSILRTVDLKHMKSVFVRSDSSDFPEDILEKQVDGILCTDGSLQYSKEYHRLVYTYRYRNQFLCLDTALNILLTGKTIDTTSVAKISVAEVNGEIKMSKPPLVVNRGVSVDGKYLFVHSNLTARNESIEQSNNNSVIDVYNILDGHYVCSFYIANINGIRLQSFKVNNRVLVAVFPEYIARYELNREHLPI